jgi:hypothetical protein
MWWIQKGSVGDKIDIWCFHQLCLEMSSQSHPSILHPARRNSAIVNIPVRAATMVTPKSPAPAHLLLSQNIKSAFPAPCWTASTSTLKCQEWITINYPAIGWANTQPIFVPGCRPRGRGSLTGSRVRILFAMPICGLRK